MRSSIGALFALLAAASCTITVTPSPHNKADANAEVDAQPPACCRTNPDAGPEGCLCEPASQNIVMITGTTCSVSTTLNGQAIVFTGIVVPTCP